MSALSMLSLALPKEEGLFKELVIEYVKLTYKVDMEDMEITDEPVFEGFTIFAKPKPEEKDEEDGKDEEDDPVKRNVLVQSISSKLINHDTEVLDAWIEDNDEYEETPFSELILVLADHSDDNLVEHIKKVNEERIKYNEFKVSLMFWDDLEMFIRSNRAMMKQYYPKFLEFEDNLQKMAISKRNLYKVPDVATMKEICIDEMEEYGILRMLQIDPGIGFTIRLLVAADSFAVAMLKLEDAAKHLAERSEAYRRMIKFIITYNKFVERMAAFCEVDMDTKWVRIIPSYRNERVADQLGDLKAEVTDRMNELFKYWAHI